MNPSKLREMDNSKLQTAKNDKKDEFYTLLPDIEKELGHYKDCFQGKVVYCNCDDNSSNFYEYFVLHAKELGISYVICSWYNPEGKGKFAYFDPNNPSDNPYQAYTLDRDNGSYNCDECKERFLSVADIVVTNPPFSKFRDYIDILFKYNKKFIILGTLNGFKYKEVFPYVKEGKVWAGFGFNMSVIFKTPYPNTSADNAKNVRNKGYNPDEGYVTVSSICWFTNLECAKRSKPMELKLSIKDRQYLKYDNFDAIDVNKVTDIPYDYDGIMGVPITILGKLNDSQFEIIGEANHGCDNKYDLFMPTIGGHILFPRILIKRK